MWSVDIDNAHRACTGRHLSALLRARPRDTGTSSIRPGRGLDLTGWGHETGRVWVSGLVGRDCQWTVLRDALTRAVSGAGGVLIVRGDPGIGKSTLIGGALEASDFTSFVGHAVPGGSRPGRVVSEIAVAAIPGARLDDPAVALFRRPVEALIGTAVADPSLVENPRRSAPMPPPSGRVCSG